jgi:Serine/threonine protein kinase
MAKLSHRNIVAVYDIVSNDSIAYIAMEYLSGGALSDRMRSGIALADAVSVIVQIAGALEFAHGHGVVHRDLKPANIMFRENGTPILPTSVLPAIRTGRRRGSRRPACWSARRPT